MDGKSLYSSLTLFLFLFVSPYLSYSIFKYITLKEKGGQQKFDTNRKKAL